MEFLRSYFGNKNIFKKTNDLSNDKNPIVNENKKSGDFLLWNMTELEAGDLCKHRLDTMELWSRRLIEETFSKEYGKDYFNFKFDESTPLVKNEIIKQVQDRVDSNPKRYPRKVDALVMEYLKYFFCRNDLYKLHFKNVFEPFYSGIESLRLTFEKLISIRNKISHTNPLSQRELEQGVCYSNDLIEVFKEYYKKIGRDKEYNVPTFLSFKDSLGHCIYREDTNYSWSIYPLTNYDSTNNKRETVNLKSGETYRIILEVDNSFPLDFYCINWEIEYCCKIDKYETNSNILEFKIDDKFVSLNLRIKAYLKTKRAWHRFANIDCDDFVEIHLEEILPPINDDYFK